MKQESQYSLLPTTPPLIPFPHSSGLWLYLPICPVPSLLFFSCICSSLSGRWPCPDISFAGFKSKFFWPNFFNFHFNHSLVRISNSFLKLKLNGKTTSSGGINTFPVSYIRFLSPPRKTKQEYQLMWWHAEASPWCRNSTACLFPIHTVALPKWPASDPPSFLSLLVCNIAP